MIPEYLRQYSIKISGTFGGEYSSSHYKNVMLAVKHEDVMVRGGIIRDLMIL